MAVLLDDLPFPDRREWVSLPDGKTIHINPNQIILWITVGSRDDKETPPSPKEERVRIRPIPAVLDTGFNNDFVMRERHFREWTKHDPSEFPQSLTKMPLPEGQELPRIDVSLWLYRNIPGTNELADAPPCRLELNRGLALSDPDDLTGKPRLPLFGMTALECNDLIVHLYAKRRRVTIETNSLNAPDTVK